MVTNRTCADRSVAEAQERLEAIVLGFNGDGGFNSSAIAMTSKGNSTPEQSLLLPHSEAASVWDTSQYE